MKAIKKNQNDIFSWNLSRQAERKVGRGQSQKSIAVVLVGWRWHAAQSMSAKHHKSQNLLIKVLTKRWCTIYIDKERLTPSILPESFLFLTFTSDMSTPSLFVISVWVSEWLVQWHHFQIKAFIFLIWSPSLIAGVRRGTTPGSPPAPLGHTSSHIDSLKWQDLSWNQMHTRWCLEHTYRHTVTATHTVTH